MRKQFVCPFSVINDLSVIIYQKYKHLIINYLFSFLNYKIYPLTLLLVITEIHRKQLFFSVLFLCSVFVLKAQEETFFCGTVFEESVPPAVQFGPKKHYPFSGSVDPDYLASFEPISFNIYFWIINPENEDVEFTPITYEHIKANMKRINELFKPMGICFVLNGYDYFKSDQLFENETYWYITSEAMSLGKYHENSFNVYIVNSLVSYQANGVTKNDHNTIVIKRSHFIGNPWDIFPGNVLAHELAHDFYLDHPWELSNNTISTLEHVTRDPNNPNYNALEKGDLVHDIPTMVSFYAEAQQKSVSIYDIINPETCEYMGDLTDNLGVPFELTPIDVGNVMAYTYQPCITTGFTVGQGIKIREWIANPNGLYKKSLHAKRFQNNKREYPIICVS